MNERRMPQQVTTDLRAGLLAVGENNEVMYLTRCCGAPAFTSCDQAPTVCTACQAEVPAFLGETWYPNDEIGWDRYQMRLMPVYGLEGSFDKKRKARKFVNKAVR